MTTGRSLALLLLAGSLARSLAAQADSTRTRATVSGFVDVYYAYDFGRPTQHDRPFVTQAVRHDELNVNLAHLALTLERASVRARVALQAGTAVQANYAAEPGTGVISGSDVVRHIQEATIGVRATPALWIDAGIYLSYIGWEGWISSANPTYTRSMVAEFTPYYLSGVRATWAAAKRVTIQAHLMNGWQNIAENNDGKAGGIRIDVAPSDRLTLVYANFLGREPPATGPAETRFFQQVMARGLLGRAPWQAQVDVGHSGARNWYGWALAVSWPLGKATALATRVERYADPDQVIVPTGGLAGFEATSASAGIDRTLPGGVLWRAEARWLRASTPLFPDRGNPAGTRSNLALITSLALSF